MDPKQYEQYRNSLIALLDEVLAIVGLPEPHAGELRLIRRKCQEDQFEVALVGAFQGGKSTTFNALCDGREISPRGLSGGGIKTSAGVLTAQHISDLNEGRDGLQEWAEVTWRNDISLLLGMADLIRDYLIEDTEFQRQHLAAHPDKPIQAGILKQQLAACLDLREPYQQDAIKRALRQEWTKWSISKQTYDADRLDVLRIATLHMRFLDNPELQRLRQRTVFSVPDMQRLVVFPIDWLQRWHDGESGAEAFKPEEAAFAFIERVLIRVRSANLGRLGCRLTDCPGLFVSAWDTAIAQDVMAQADAIWFLLGGDKSLTQEAGHILDFIKERGWHSKLYVTVNLRGDQSHDHMRQHIVPAIAEALAARGLTQTPYPYDAFLAFRAAQGRLLLERPQLLAERDRQALAEEARQPVEDLDPLLAWRRIVRRRCVTADLLIADQIHGEKGLTPEVVQELERLSGMENILSSVETMVVNQKARSILVTNGARPAIQALERLENDLKNKEDAARQKVEEFHAQVQQHEERLAKFEADSKEYIALLDDDSIDHAIFDAFWDEVILTKVRQQTIKQAASKIMAELTFWNSLNEKRKAEKASAILAEAFEKAFEPAAVQWMEELKQGKNQVFQDKVGLKTKWICEQVRKRWKEHIPEHILTEDHMLAGIRLPEVSGIWAQDEAMLRRHIDNKALLTSLSTEVPDVSPFNVKYAVGFGALAGIGTAAACVLLVSNPIGWVVGGLAAAIGVGWLAGHASGVGKEDAKKKIEAYLTKALDTSLLNQRKDMQKTYCKRTIKLFRTAYKTYLEDSLAEIRRTFQARKEEKEALFMQANADRQRIAEEAQHLRTSRIEPARSRIQDFQAMVEQAL